MSNILLQANEIVNQRAEEKEREYGPFSDSMAKAARIASELCNKEITQDDFYKCMIALKLSRLAYNTKEDTLLDGVAYMAAFNNLKNNKQNGNVKKSGSSTRTKRSGTKK